MNKHADLIKSLRNGQEYDYDSGDMINCDSTLNEATTIETLMEIKSELLKMLKTFVVLAECGESPESNTIDKANEIINKAGE